MLWYALIQNKCKYNLLHNTRNTTYTELIWSISNAFHCCQVVPELIQFNNNVTVKWPFILT